MQPYLVILLIFVVGFMSTEGVEKRFNNDFYGLLNKYQIQQKRFNNDFYAMLNRYQERPINGFLFSDAYLPISMDYLTTTRHTHLILRSNELNWIMARTTCRDPGTKPMSLVIASLANQSLLTQRLLFDNALFRFPSFHENNYITHIIISTSIQSFIN
uniref:Uncharacterized protein n=1 Tax=Heterorhabditis bacteriophora TaxID=37862 RepID=A0A1I7WE12_HETBA